MTAIRPIKSEDGHVSWLCRCACGNVRLVRSDRLVSGRVEDCGCVVKPHRNRSYSGQRLRSIWRAMLHRCKNTKDASYRNYGGRGISVCSEWEDFNNFEKWAFDNGYDINAKFGELTLDRIDVNSNYSPDNCRFISIQQQQENRTNCKRIVGADGSFYSTISACAKRYGLSPNTVKNRIAHGIPIDGVVYKYAESSEVL